ncbi:hypothetical protein N0V90_009462 [Kalmusia sp. IMI 367209]|nr:hypothetical protein N0V90_009462 [Kalmusia sp. IMI 367209]
MADREFSLQLGIPKEYPRKWTVRIPEEFTTSRSITYIIQRRYSYPCHNSDGLLDCECMKNLHDEDGFNAGIEECCFYGRPTEPLAFILPSFADVHQQKQSPLYAVLPKEIRDLVWEYALADDGAPSADSDNGFRRERGIGAAVAKVDSACALLQTCKAVYLETYRLPMLLNGYLAYRINNFRGGYRIYSPSRPDLEHIAPWQYALINRVDLSLQQVSVEDDDLRRELENWKPALRHSGSYVAPRFYSISRPKHRAEGEVAAHNFALTTPPKNATGGLKDGDKVTLRRYEYQIIDSNDAELDGGRVQITGSFTARAMVARPLTHLTLRISRTDWWTWTDDPMAADSDKQLALDPACGGVNPRPLVTDMVALATSRRAGQHPSYDKTWGATIGLLPDLKTLELILETFSAKTRQLETVVDCAKTWRFPLKNTRYELVCDGRIDSMKWGIAPDVASNGRDSSRPHQESARYEQDRARFSSPQFSPIQTYSAFEATSFTLGVENREPSDAEVEQGSTSGHSSLGAADFAFPFEGTVTPNYEPESPSWVSEIQPDISKIQPNISKIQPNISAMGRYVSGVQSYVSEIQPDISDV